MGSSTGRLSCFKAYDVRGRVPDELNENVAELIGTAYADFLRPTRVAVGHDVRLTSVAMSQALCRGLTRRGVKVIDLGLVGTEEVYFATFAQNLDGGVMVTASHNPRDYNGMKFTREHARPISADTGLLDIERAVVRALDERSRGLPAPSENYSNAPGTVEMLDGRDAYVRHLLTYVNLEELKPLKIVVNAGNGGAGPVIDLLERHVPFEFVKIHHHPDGTFPNGVPNPLLPENRAATADAVVSEGADMGVAWDGDFDRCFFFDELGGFVEGYYLVGLLAQQALGRHPGAKIIHDPRLVWNTLELVAGAGGVPVMCKSGHAFIKERMRTEDAAYGGEMSAHHYFKEFSYCDSGMIPWLQVAERLSREGRSLSDLVGEMTSRFPVSGELNLQLDDPSAAIAAMKNEYRGDALSTDETDGLSVEFPLWRFNVRMSNTEPVVRVNVEARQDVGLLQKKTSEIIDFLRTAGARDGS